MTEDHPPKKKPRRVRGCYNCSQRRINCDRGTPACQKCLKKGLECLGLGTRYRFQNGVASRGKLAGKTLPLRNADDERHASHLPAQDQGRDIPTSEDSRKVLHSSHLDYMDGQSRFLLQYFSENVSPAMVAVNATILNGYKDFILPLSEQDEIVRNAAMAASSYHLGLRYPEWNSVALRYHTTAIKGLSKRKDGKNIGKSIAYSNLSTMLLLLIEEMITGKKGNDYKILLRMINSFVKSQGGEESIEQNLPGKFLIQQIRKMSLYSTPLISEQSARFTLANISQKDLGFLYSVIESYPEHSSIILRITDLIHKACNIYMARATGLPQQVIDGLVQSFINETSVFNATSPGGHILIWPFFIVGAECSQERDRKFVVEQLHHLWRRTGFANTLYAIDALRETWNDESGSRWTEVIAEKVEVFIM